MAFVGTARESFDWIGIMKKRTDLEAVKDYGESGKQSNLLYMCSVVHTVQSVL